MDTSRKRFFVGVGVLIFFLVSYAVCISAPAEFTSPVIFRVEQGSGLRSVSLQLKRQHIIRSRAAFEAFVILYGAERYINYSDYLFEPRLPVYEVARRIAYGEHHLSPVVVTIPEGWSNAEIAETVASKLTHFDKSKFLVQARGLEGYLFPDTYFFLPADTEDTVIVSLRKNFNTKIASILPDIKNSSKTEKQIVIMASIIEKEAKGDADREYISGILWKRFSICMPLQADAAPQTYRAKGLPESPICNPGLESLRAALYPHSSPYLYYLHDKNGAIHYARTFAEHVSNKQKYLQ